MRKSGQGVPVINPWINPSLPTHRRARPCVCPCLCLRPLAAFTKGPEGSALTSSVWTTPTKNARDLKCALMEEST